MTSLGKSRKKTIDLVKRPSEIGFRAEEPPRAQILLYTHFFEQEIPLWDMGNSSAGSAMRWQPFDALAEERDLARNARQEARDSSQEGAFAVSVRPDQSG